MIKNDENDYIKTKTTASVKSNYKYTQSYLHSLYHYLKQNHQHYPASTWLDAFPCTCWVQLSVMHIFVLQGETEGNRLVLKYSNILLLHWYFNLKVRHQSFVYYHYQDLA